MGQTTRLQAIIDGLSAMHEAWRDAYGEELTRELGRVWGGQMLFESNFGRNYGQLGYDHKPEMFWGTNDYGAYMPDSAFRKAHAHDPGFGEVLHRDSTSTGKPVIWAYRVFPNQYEAAKDWLARWGGIVKQSGGDPHQYATDAYHAGYFTGTSGTAEDRINWYAGILAGTLSAVDDGYKEWDGGMTPNDPHAPTGDDTAPGAQIVYYAGKVNPPAGPGAAEGPSSSPPQASPSVPGCSGGDDGGRPYVSCLTDTLDLEDEELAGEVTKS